MSFDHNGHRVTLTAHYGGFTVRCDGHVLGSIQKSRRGTYVTPDGSRHRDHFLAARALAASRLEN